MKVDLHVHARERSSCSVASEEELIQAAIAAGLDAMVFTDHHRLTPAKRLAELNRRYAPFRIFGGVEVTTREGEDILVLGVREAQLERPGWSYPDLHAFVRGHNGFLALAHPFRFSAPVLKALEQHVPDAIEIYSHNTPRWAEDAIRALSIQLGVALLSNSDAHAARSLGMHYNQLSRPIEGEKELIELLQSRQFTIHGP